jgi:hypothetical protein
MMEKLIVENQGDDMPLDDFVKIVQDALGMAHSAVAEGENCLVLAYDCRDAEDEITNLLDEAGVECYVYKSPDYKEIHKITTGFVVQRWDRATGKFLGQEFIAGDECDYEDENGNPIDEEEPEYRSFDMVQEPSEGFTLTPKDIIMDIPEEKRE